MNRSYPEKLEGSKCAMVLQKKQEFSLAKYFEGLNKDLQSFIVFYDIDATKKWLGFSKRDQ